MLFQSFINKLSENLKHALPGVNAQQRMCSDIRPEELMYSPESTIAKKCGVMILIFPYLDELYSVLILRAVGKGVHSAQVALPGGKYEENDENITYTALRETNEEIGVPASDIQIIGNLTKLYVPPSNYILYPIVGYTPDKPHFIPSPDEVSEIITYKLIDLLKKENIKRKEFTVLDKIKFSAPYFDINGYVVWGATAMILSEFAEILKNKEIQNCEFGIKTFNNLN